MKRLTISVDDIATLRYLLNDGDFDPVQFGILCEVAGAHGISVTLSDTQIGIQERDIHLLKQLHKTFLNLHIPPEPESVRLALTVNPDMVTFVEVNRGETLKISPLSSLQIEQTIPNIISDFHANNISVAVFCYPEISILKQMNKVEIDYVEFDCLEYTMATDSNEELLALDKLNSATLAAAKLGFGINCYGGIDYVHLPVLTTIPRLEDICMGISIIKRSFLVGINQAVAEARQQMVFHQQE